MFLQASQEKEQLKEVKGLQEHLSQVISDYGPERIKMLKEEVRGRAGR